MKEYAAYMRKHIENDFLISIEQFTYNEEPRISYKIDDTWNFIERLISKITLSHYESNIKVDQIL